MKSSLPKVLQPLGGRPLLTHLLDTAITLDIASALTDTDGSESLSIVISGVPTGANLSAGTDNGDGTWTLTQGQLSGLTLTPPSDSDTDFTLTVTAPRSVNRMAFATRFNSICRSRPGSPSSHSGTLGAT